MLVRLQLLVPFFASLLVWCTSSEHMLDLRLVPISSLPEETNLTVLNRKDLPRRGFLVRTTEQWSVITPPEKKGNGARNRFQLDLTSNQAAKHDCLLATNGGPFHADGSFCGAVIEDGQIMADQFNLDSVGFGRTRGINQSWVVGPIKDIIEAERLQIQHYVTGFDWLVYDYENVPETRNNTSGTHRAPRTAIGVDREGRLLLLVVDGCEKCLTRQGVTLGHLAQILIHEGAQYAINLDGGSSSVIVNKIASDGSQRVVNHPTCLDYVPFLCERPVGTVMCIVKLTPNDRDHRGREALQ